MYGAYYGNPINDRQSMFDVQKKQERTAVRHTVNTCGLILLLSTVAFQLTATVIYLIMYYCGSENLGKDYDAIPSFIYNSLTSLLVFGILGMIFIKATRQKAGDLLVFNKVKLQTLFMIAAIGFSVCMVSNYLINLLDMNLNLFGYGIEGGNAPSDATSIPEMLIFIVSVAIVPAFTEEFVFRGLILGSLRRYGDGFALIVSAVIFGLMHANFTQIPFAFAGGLVFGWAVIYTNSLLPAMAIHALNNLFSVFNDIAYENFESLGMPEYLIDVLIYAIMITIMILGVYSVNRLSKSDKGFMSFSQYEGILSFKERIKLFLTSPTVIISTAIILGLSIYTEVLSH